MLLRRGVAEVVAVDVGYGQLAWALQTDPRVTVVDRTNVRDLTIELVGGRPVDLVVGDLSFISLGLVLAPLRGVCSPSTQTSCSWSSRSSRSGASASAPAGSCATPDLRAEAVRTIAERASGLGLGTAGVTASPLPGPAGNVEYFLWLTADAPAPEPQAIRPGRPGRTAVTLRPYEAVA